MRRYCPTWILDNQSYLFAVTRESSAWQLVPQGTAAIDAAVGKLRAGLFNAEVSTLAPFDLVASHELYRALLGNIEGFIADKPKLLLVPAGSLTSLPFQVLVTSPPDPAVKPEERSRSAAWLLNDKAVTVLPSVASLRSLRIFAKTSRATKPFIGFGDPVFRSTGGDKRGDRPQRSALSGLPKGTLVDLDALRKGLPALPETGEELRAVARELGAPASEVRLGREVTVTSVRAASLEQYRVVGFATHGLVAGEVNGLSEPALVLSLPDNPSADDDGLLTASRVAKLSLADWEYCRPATPPPATSLAPKGHRAGACFLLCGRSSASGVALAGGIRRCGETYHRRGFGTRETSVDRARKGAATLHPSVDRRPLAAPQRRAFGMGTIRASRRG